MNRDEIMACLNESIGKVVRITFTQEALNPMTPLRDIPVENQSGSIFDSRIQDLAVINLDDEGFVNRIRSEEFWSTFDDVENVELLV